MALNKREFMLGAIATAVAAGLPITGAIALADAIKPEGMPTALVPFAPIQFDPNRAAYDVTTIEQLRAYIGTLLKITPPPPKIYDDEELVSGLGLVMEGADRVVEKWTGHVFAFGWHESEEAIEDGRYNEPRMIANVCRFHAMAVAAWVERDGLRGKPAVWRRSITHRSEREFEHASIKHIISFRIAVKV